MSIGRGWFPDEPKDEKQDLAEKLLKDLLKELFSHPSKGVNGGRYYAFSKGKSR